ncbi:hypothetical protein SEA_BILLNYE_178 [Streptomyces phage BillNye]|uniref:Uncharacterized protein n=2 Tax=Wilnyevirus billnye TaxID=2560486 RepID=A0A2L1IVW5_9CAUD|nr:hypothetical protein FDJ30_gp083 [Streptomyces phage BillNye]AVD99350.1 hypothetical protein SEA_BILLNYE_178 [Streptomyces phage BillNye]QBZ72433.1 hypothetical protein SEA_CIRCINUS_179 [Streptomyces phage Circinus]
MPSVMLGEDEVVEIVELLRGINRDIGDPEDWGIPDYLLEAMPEKMRKHSFTLVIESNKDDLDLDIDSLRAVVFGEVNDAEARVSLTFDGVS